MFLAQPLRRALFCCRPFCRGSILKWIFLHKFHAINFFFSNFSIFLISRIIFLHISSIVFIFSKAVEDFSFSNFFIIISIYGVPHGREGQFFAILYERPFTVFLCKTKIRKGSN